MKNLFLTITILFVSIFFSASAFASENSLHTITLEKNNSGYNIILGADKVTKVSKKAVSEDELVLLINGISSSETVNALYKGTNNIDSLIVENAGKNRLKVYVKADNVKNSTIMIEPITGVTTIVGEDFPIDKVLWIVFVMALFCIIFKISKDITEDEDKILIKKDIKDREIEMYRKYRAQVVSRPEIVMNNDLRMKKMLKKIDRKIDERLYSSIR